MDLQSLVLRAAEPTFEEGRVYGGYLNDIAPGFRYTLGRRAVDVIAAVYVEPGHNLSFEHATFAECDGAIVGVVAGYAGSQLAGSDESLKRALRGVGIGSARIAASAKWMRYFGPEADDEYYVWLLAVSEGLRGQGIGSVLMDFIEDRARRSESTRLTLDADAKSEGARRFYERRGMTVVSGWPRSRLLPTWVIRMAKPL